MGIRPAHTSFLVRTIRSRFLLRMETAILVVTDPGVGMNATS
jgi:hypothetical protein